MNRFPVLRGMAVMAVPASSFALGIKAPVAGAEVDQADKSLLGDWRFDEGEATLPAIVPARATTVKSSADVGQGQVRHRAALCRPRRVRHDPRDGRARWIRRAHRQGVGVLGKDGKYPNIVTGGTWCPGGFLLFVADDACSFRLGKPGPTPQGPANSDWTETGASLVQFTPGRGTTSW